MLWVGWGEGGKSILRQGNSFRKGYEARERTLLGERQAVQWGWRKGK